MRLLLDTHAFLWFILDDPQLSHTVKTLVEDSRNEVNISPASYWEIAIKIRLGKYSLPGSYQQFMEAQITANDLLTTMPLHHRDPFDRLIVAQAIAEDFILASVASPLDAYGVRRLW